MSQHGAPKYTSDPDTLWPEVEVHERTLHGVRRADDREVFLVERTEAQAHAFIQERSDIDLEYVTATETTVIARTSWRRSE